MKNYRNKLNLLSQDINSRLSSHKSKGMPLKVKLSGGPNKRLKQKTCQRCFCTLGIPKQIWTSI